MRQILKTIEEGKFADDWLDKCEGGASKLQKERQELKKHAIEETGKNIRELFTISQLR